jgi:pimeloyl-ACP methyl ester carboxylesterase
VVGAGQAPRYLPLIPGSRFQLLPGAGHAPQSDAADAIIALVRQTAAWAVERSQASSGAPLEVAV